MIAPLLFSMKKSVHKRWHQLLRTAVLSLGGSGMAFDEQQQLAQIQFLQNPSQPQNQQRNSRTPFSGSGYVAKYGGGGGPMPYQYKGMAAPPADFVARQMLAQSPYAPNTPFAPSTLAMSGQFPIESMSYVQKLQVCDVTK